MKVQAIRENKDSKPTAKAVAANQKALDDLALGTGTWRVAGTPGLYVRCRATSKSFFIQRRVKNQLVMQTLGQLSMKAAKEKAMKTWSAMKPKPAPGDAVTLGSAFEAYVTDKALAPKTAHNYRYNLDHYLEDWKKRSLHDIGADRAGVRALQRHVKKHHGPAASNQVVRLLSSVYRWARKEDPELPEPPTVAVQVDKIAARDWGYSPEELQAWWHAIVKEEGKPDVHKGVSTLGAIKRMWWLTALFTGARKGSVEALKWLDLDFDKKSIRFTVTKGDRPYTVPMSDTLAELLTRYRDSGDVPPSEWVFPSSAMDGRHIVDVKNDKQGVGPAHRLRHTFRTTLAQLGASSDQARLLMGHSMGGDVSRGYITAPLLVESLRPITNAVTNQYAKILGFAKGSENEAQAHEEPSSRKCRSTTGR